MRRQEMNVQIHERVRQRGGVSGGLYHTAICLYDLQFAIYY